MNLFFSNIFTVNKTLLLLQNEQKTTSSSYKKKTYSNVVAQMGHIKDVGRVEVVLVKMDHHLWKISFGEAG